MVIGLYERLVVGVGSVDSSYPAIDWAAREASGRRANLHLVRAYHPSAGILPWEAAAEADYFASYRRLAETALRDAKTYVTKNWRTSRSPTRSSRASRGTS